MRENPVYFSLDDAPRICQMIAAYIVILLVAGAVGVAGKRRGLRASLPLALIFGVVICGVLTIWIQWRVIHGPYP